MTTRHAHTRALAAAYRRACESKDAAYHALLGALSENQRKVLDFVSNSHYSVDAAGLEYWLTEWAELPHLDAATILKELADFGLLEREAVLTDSGREFRYRLAK